MPLIALIAALASGQSIGAVLGALSSAQWVALAETVIPLGEDAMSLLASIHPVVDIFFGDIAKGASNVVAAGIAHSYFANQPPTIKGYDSQGGVTDIPNPDYRNPT